MRYRFRFSKSVIPVIKQDNIKIEPSNLSCACQTNQFTGELAAGMMSITHVASHTSAPNLHTCYRILK